MGTPYYQFCPVAKAMELLDERWTMLVVRELACGSERFNDLRRGLPRMSPSLLSQRLTQLERAGLVVRHAEDDGVRYRLSEAGEELRPIVEAIGGWGIRWIGNLGDEDLDPKLLLWDMHRNVDHAALPTGRTVVQFDFRDIESGQRRWWLVLTEADVDVCDHDPGFDIAVTVDASLRGLVRVWRGDTTWRSAVRTGDLSLAGPERMRRALPSWFTLSDFAPVPRPRRAPERAAATSSR